MSNIPPIQNLPPLSSITDPAVRNYLQILTNGWRVRNGEVGEGDEKFVTVSDLKDGVTEVASAVAGATSSGLQLPTGKSDIATKISTEFKKLSNSILQSRMWKSLEQRIDALEAPDWFDKQFGAAIKTQDIIRESANQAIADHVETSVAKINSNLAIAQQNITAVSNQAGSTASQVTTLQSTVTTTNNNLTSTTNTANAAAATAQQAFSLSQTVDGKLSSSWSVKVDTGGYVAGFGLGVDGKSGTYTSDFTVRADRFAIGGTGTQKTVPFFVQNGKTWIDSAMIVDGSIANAKIGNAAIDSAKIVDGAITNAKIGNAAITSAKIADASITSAKIGSLQVLSANIADLTVGTNKITGNACTVATGGDGIGTTYFYLNMATNGYFCYLTLTTGYYGMESSTNVYINDVPVITNVGNGGTVHWNLQNPVAGNHVIKVVGNGPNYSLFAVAFMK